MRREREELRSKDREEEMSNSLYLHDEDMRKMALVCSSPGPLLIEGSLHTPPHSHILGLRGEAEYVIKKIA